MTINDTNIEQLKQIVREYDNAHKELLVLEADSQRSIFSSDTADSIVILFTKLASDLIHNNNINYADYNSQIQNMKICAFDAVCKSYYKDNDKNIENFENVRRISNKENKAKLNNIIDEANNATRLLHKAKSLNSNNKYETLKASCDRYILSEKLSGEISEADNYNSYMETRDKIIKITGFILSTVSICFLIYNIYKYYYG